MSRRTRLDSADRPPVVAAIRPLHSEGLGAQAYECRDSGASDDGSVRIDVGDGLFAIVDAIDADRVLERPWRILRTGSRYRYAVVAKKRGQLMHRLILSPPTGQFVDHVNGNGLDNRRVNLRVCSRVENQRNRKRMSNSSNPYKGIVRTRHGKWRARIRVDGVRRFVSGSLSSPEEAAHAYDAAAIAAFGEFACINFPHKHPEFSYRKAG